MSEIVLLTGAAGFIGMHAGLALLERGCHVVGVDSLNDYYDVQLKRDRLARLQAYDAFSFERLDLAHRAAVAELFERVRPDCVLHLAAQAGVRYSLEQPHAYADANLVGFLNVLEGCREIEPRHLVFASSSSVYGGSTKLPYREDDCVDQPISLYAATKKANELMAHSYAHLYGIPITGLRFFTVYGPWGRPDMAYFSFTRNILNGEPIRLFNHGQMYRDFTYIDDIVEGVMRVMEHAPEADESGKRFCIYNIGNDRPEKLEHFVHVLEQVLGRKAIREMAPMQPGDVPCTHADLTRIRRDFGFEPKTTIEEGLVRFVEWFRDYYGRKER
ncbi:MAG: NAD-dependent epimerase/dehydratase family protein [Zetaproteobacteria bacterium]|nr:MAG: NAD-dependent epimerase/dehydratase family protein [Zetaproteobacteria bacterium]